jgi:dodecin
LNTAVPSPYSVNCGAWVTKNSIGTSPPPDSMRRITSVAAVGWWIVVVCVGSSDAVRAGVVVDVGLFVAVGLEPAPRNAEQPAATNTKAVRTAMWKACGRGRMEPRPSTLRIARRRSPAALGSSHTLGRKVDGVREREMGVLIIREMVGTSTRSWSDAARNAVATASRTVRNIREIEVVKSSARVEDGEIVEYRVELKLHFEYEGG